MIYVKYSRLEEECKELKKWKDCAEELLVCIRDRPLSPAWIRSKIRNSKLLIDPSGNAE